jgi:geranylgeranyl pyrophosphate synthase
MAGSPSCSVVDVRMLRACSASARSESCIAAAMQKHFSAGGSRVRANFSLDASRRLAVNEADAVTLAAICELLHNASLIQDDLLDRAPMRRGSASVWAEFGDSTAMCAGDLMLATAFALVGELTQVESMPKVLSLVHKRTTDVILGQDAEQAANPVNMQEYERIAIGKSASLLSLPFELSLLLSGNEQSIVKAQRASEAFAIAYQILDDLKDYVEDRRNGLLNAISVAMDASDLDYVAATALVRQRAEVLIECSIEDASLLPMESGAAMIAYAETMRNTLSAFAKIEPNAMEPLRHGG